MTNNIPLIIIICAIAGDLLSLELDFSPIEGSLIGSFIGFTLHKLNFKL